MNNLWEKRDGVFDVRPGSTILSTINEAILLSFAEGDSLIVFEFNGVKVSVLSTSNPILIHRDYSRAANGYIEKAVGPNPNPVLTDAEKANDDRIKAEIDRKNREWQKEFDALAAAKRNSTDAKLADAPPMEVNDEAVWQSWIDNNSDACGVAIITFAYRWAQLMQVEMAKGHNLEDVATATSSEADTEGITGSMYGAAVSTLASNWKFGDQLRRWHNLETQLGNEGKLANETGGTLNPAVLNLG